MNLIAGIYIVASLPFTLLGIFSMKYFIQGVKEALKDSKEE